MRKKKKDILENQLNKNKQFLIENNIEYNEINKKIRKENEKKDELKRIFKSDMKIYNTLTNEINTNKRNKDNIPELFIDKFPVFEVLSSVSYFG